MADYRLIHGDALEVLRGTADNSVDAIVCDPPSSISFMGKSWDSDRGGRTQWVAWLAEIMQESLRVIKPGGHGLIWALPKTAHWTACALEDAGWDVREKVYHIFGQGFPKSKSMRDIGRPELGSALKPAVEEWILVRKPLSEPSIAAQVLATGTGAINIDASRIAAPDGIDGGRDFDASPLIAGRSGNKIYGQATIRDYHPNNQGRFPSHLLLSHHPSCIRRGEKRVKGSNFQGHPDGRKNTVLGKDNRPRDAAGYADADGRELVADWECHAACPVRQLDAQAGERKGSKPGTIYKTPRYTGNAYNNGAEGGGQKAFGYGDTGSASRFFTVFEPDPDALFVYAPKASRSDRSSNGAVNNTHPTAKSTQLGRWLSRLICPVGGTILDPFAGSGSLGVSAILEGFNWIGIDESAEYIAIARARLEWAANQRPKAEQLTLTV